MNGFEFEEHVDASPEKVFAVLADPTQAVHFLDAIAESVKVSDGPIGVGTVFRETRILRGKPETAELVVTAYQPSTHVAISTEAEGISVTYDYRLTPDAGGTRLTWACDLQASGLRRMMLPLVAAIMKKEDGRHLQSLKEHLERSDDPGSSP